MSFQWRTYARNLEPAGSIDALESKDVTIPMPAAIALKAWEKVERILTNTNKYAFIAAMVLVAIWLIGRVMEALYGNIVFDPTLTYWMGVSVGILLCEWVVGSGIVYAKNLWKAKRRWPAVASWMLFLAIVLGVLYNFEGFRISSQGLFATLTGSAESSNQAIFLLFKSHPVNPMIGINLVALKIRGLGPEIESLMPYVWSSSYILGFFIWSLAYGILLLLHRDKVWPKAIHVFFAAAALGVVIVLKSVAPPTKGQMVFLHAAAVTLFIFQVLLTHASLRAYAAGSEESHEKPDPFNSSTNEKKPEIKNAFLCLPPSALKFTLFLFILFPIFADLQGQFDLAPSSLKILNEIRNTQPHSELVAVAPISVHAGPAIGDEVIGVLPKGVHVPVVKEKFKWVNIGKNEWVDQKFLRPIKK